MTTTCKGSEAVTRGVRVRVRPFYVPEQSRPDLGEYVFGYRITIANEGAQRVKLVSRRWEIVDADGETRIVEGEGVVGQQPLLLPGGVHEYSSFCALPTPWGTMEGAYIMETSEGRGGIGGAGGSGGGAGSGAGGGGEAFEAKIERFILVAPEHE